MGMILDSGAYTSWTKETPIDIDAYIAFYHKHADYIDYIVNLDVIPGEWGRATMPEEAEEACVQGFKNYKYMLKKKVPKEKLIHVFHMGDDFKYLYKMIDECTDYIGISPANDKTTAQKKVWLDDVFGNHLCKKNGYPVIRTHGFGVAAPSLIARYPWYSVDATTWTRTSCFGYAFLPMPKDGKPNYFVTPLRVNFSTRPSKPDKLNYNNGMGPAVKKYVNDYIKEHGWEIGKSRFDKGGKEIIIKPGLINTYIERDKMNMQFFIDMQNAIPEYPWKFIPEVNGRPLL